MRGSEVCQAGLGPRVILGCIDIGSNTTRLLVAEADRGALRELTADRVFTCIRKSLDGEGCIPGEKIAETVDVVCAQAAAARDLGAQEIVAVATAAIRDAPNRAELEEGVRDGCGLELRVIPGQEEARLSFVGATETLPEPAQGKVAVVDVGGGSTEIAVGSSGEAVHWWTSLPIGSGVLADRYLISDPPGTSEVEAVRRQVADTFEGIAVPTVDGAVAVGGTATALMQVLDSALDHETLERGIALVSTSPVDVLAAQLGLDPERVRVLPAGILVLQAVADRLGPLQIACGGLREGVILELAEALSPAPPAPSARADGAAP